MKIFLDDIRVPKDCIIHMQQRIGPLCVIYYTDWIIVRNYDEFVKVIKTNFKEITYVSFDHDLGEDVAKLAIEDGISKRKARQAKKNVKSGYDCAKWLRQFYSEAECKLPVMFVHSMNPVGTDNIINVFK